MFRGEEKQARPRLCPACGTLVGSTATKCHECGASLTFSLAAASRALGSLLPTESPVTYCILALNGLMFVLSLMVSQRLLEGGGFLSMSSEALYRLGARQTIAILEGQWWRLVIPIFLHGSVLHILMNTWVLMDLGPQLEELYGSSRYLFLYILTGVLSFVVSTWWNLLARGGYGISIGASGALMGLVGLMLAITTLRSGAHMQMVRAQLLRWLVYIGLFGLLSATDNAAHAGGLAAGFLLGKIVDDRQPISAAERKRAYALAWLAALVVFVSFVFMLRNYFRAG